MAAPQAELRQDKRISEHAIKSAETFVSAYYAASDSPQRTQLVPTLYLPTSSIVWNGTPVSGQGELAAMLNSMPGSKHEVQTFDCHALGGSIEGTTFTAPSILLTVSGTISHHTPESQSAKADTNAPKSAQTHKKGGFDPNAPLTSHPRAFSQNFVLVHAPGAGGVKSSSTAGKDGSIKLDAQYFVQADTFRFVG